MSRLPITADVFIETDELDISFTRARGPGGQNVNKVATAVLLRFNIKQAASLPEDVRERLLPLLANRLNRHGELIIKAGRHRTQERNRQDAIERLQMLLHRAATPAKKRKKTRPTAASRERRLQAKKLRGKVKAARGQRREE